MSNVPAESIKRVVVRGTNWLGDSLMTIPALRALRHVLPEAHITLVTRPGTKGIFSEVDFVDEILVYDRKNAFAVVPQVREWRRRKFDLAVLFQNAFEAALITALEQMLFGRSTICEAEPDASITISEARKAQAAELLRAYGVSEDDAVVVICPGSINSRAK